MTKKHLRNAQLNKYCKIDKSASEKLFYKHPVTWQDIFNIGVDLMHKPINYILQENYLK